MMSMVNLVAIGMETLRINSKCSLEKEFTELIPMNPSIVLCITRRINQEKLEKYFEKDFD